MEVVNLAPEARDIELYAGVGFELGGWVPYGGLENYAVAEALSAGLIYADNSYDRERADVRNDAFFAALRNPDGVACSKRRFMGDVYRNWDAPQSVVAGGTPDSTRAMNEDMVGVAYYRLHIAVAKPWHAEFVNAPLMKPKRKNWCKLLILQRLCVKMQPEQNV